jgi:hypothetical protein
MIVCLPGRRETVRYIYAVEMSKVSLAMAKGTSLVKRHGIREEAVLPP